MVLGGRGCERTINYRLIAENGSRRNFSRRSMKRWGLNVMLPAALRFLVYNITQWCAAAGRFLLSLRFRSDWSGRWIWILVEAGSWLARQCGAKRYS